MAEGKKNASEHKRLLLLGFLLQGPLTGYDLHRTVVAHGELYSDLKKPNLYHLLAGMEREGLVSQQIEGGARGPRRQRIIYSLTPAGRRVLVTLLRSVLQSFEPTHTGLEVAVVLLEQTDDLDAGQLLETRLSKAIERRNRVSAELGHVEPGTAGDHLICLIDAEIAWTERALDRLNRREPDQGHSRAQP